MEFVFFRKSAKVNGTQNKKGFNTVPAINCRCLWFSVVTLLALQFTNRIFRQTKRQIIIDVCEMGRPNSRKKHGKIGSHKDRITEKYSYRKPRYGGTQKNRAETRIEELQDKNTINWAI